MLGVSIGTSVGGCNSVRLTINSHAISGALSDWGFSEVVVWNRTLPFAEMKKVSDAMLKSVCGDNFYWNNITNVCTACPPNSINDITKCICTSEGYTWDVQSNTCELSLEFIYNKMINVTANIYKDIAKINTINQKLSATLTKLRKTTTRKKNTEL